MIPECGRTLQYFKILFITIRLFIEGFETDGEKFYHPNRILVLVLEDLDEESIQAPISGLLQESVIDIVSL